MERRDFLKLASLAGLTVISGGIASKAEAFDMKTKTLWLFVNLGGGWDPTSSVDPHGAVNGQSPNKYPASGIKQAGNIPYAPMELSEDVAQAALDTSVIDTFFNAHYNDILVINGVDTATNSHDAGSRNTWSGGLVEGRASLGALIAAAQAKESPMAYITNGGYDFTNGVVGATRTGNLGSIIQVAYPNRIQADRAESELYRADRTNQFVAAARQARYDALNKAQRLPRIKAAMNRLYTARLGQNELAQLTAFLPAELEDGMAGQAQLAFAAFQAGLCVSANLSAPGGYDTHGMSDVGQTQNLIQFLPQLGRVLELAEIAGIRDRVAIVVGSDFGRTPGYNDGNGKDHWSITSMMVLGWVNGRKLTGNKVVGKTDGGHNPILIDPSSLAESGSGARITPAVVHRELRKLAGVADNAELNQMTPITDPVEMPNLITLD